MSDPRLYQTVQSGEVAIDSTADVFTWNPVTPVELIRVGVLSTTTYDGTADAVIEVDINSSDGDGTFTRGDAVGTIDCGDDANFAIGRMVYHDLATRERLRPGDQLIFQVATAATAGDGIVFVEYRKLPMQSGSSAPADDLLLHATES